MIPVRALPSLLLALLLAPHPTAAQAGDGALWRVDLEPLYATASGVWRVGGGWWVGPEVGLGLQEPVTLAPDDGDFASIVHAGGLATRRLGERAALDLAARVGLGDLLSGACPASDCLPEPWAGAAAGLAWGGDRWRLGTRLVLARQEDRTVAAWVPLFLRIRF